MRCQWQEVMRVIPPWMRDDVDRLGKSDLQELRLRLGQRPQLRLKTSNVQLTGVVTDEDIKYVVNTGSRYSPWAASSVAQGYLTIPGGHRIGLCGEAVVYQGEMTGIRNVTGLCIRIARDFPGIAAGFRDLTGSILILGPPGSGKTTLLRDLIRQRSNEGHGCVAVVDERRELFPGEYFDPGGHTDVMTGCSKAVGVEMMLRTMGPSCIAVDEITAEEDCKALIEAGWCGVTLLATAHAANKQDLLSRKVYRPLAECGLFDTLVVMLPDKSWRQERMNL